MQIGLVTLFPEMFAAIAEHGISGRAIRSKLVSLDFWNPRDFSLDKHRTVDDKPFGGGPGMLMKTEPLVASIQAAKSSLSNAKVTYLSPQGTTLTQNRVVELAAEDSLILVCGRYQGIDARILETEIDEEISLGDFVISGGEIAAMALIDAMIRFQPRALGDKDSAQQDSFAGGLLHSPEYTRPQNFKGQEVPTELLNGNHEVIRKWRVKQSLGATWLKRPDLLEDASLSLEQEKLLQEFKLEHEQEQILGANK